MYKVNGFNRVISVALRSEDYFVLLNSKKGRCFFRYTDPFISMYTCHRLQTTLVRSRS